MSLKFLNEITVLLGNKKIPNAKKRALRISKHLYAKNETIIYSCGVLM